MGSDLENEDEWFWVESQNLAEFQEALFFTFVFKPQVIEVREIQLFISVLFFSFEKLVN